MTTERTQEPAMAGREGRRGDLLVAAAQRFVEVGVRATTMEDVARTAGAGKATLYRYFANKDALIDALLEREAARFDREVAAAAAQEWRAPDQVVAAYATGVAFFVEHPVLTRGRDEEPGLLLPRITARRGPLVEAGLDRFAQLVQAGVAAGELREVEPRAVAELLMRLVLSYFAFPPMHVEMGDRDAARRFARDLIVPGLVP